MKIILAYIKSLFLVTLLNAIAFISSAQVSNTLPWTWVNGDNTANGTGVYGTMGTPAAANKPGAREGCGINWTDSAGNLWLFGGYGYNASSQGWLSDLWKYAPTTNQWTWVNGDNTLNNAGTYGTKGVAAAGNRPGGRHLATTWADNAGNLWLFGGAAVAGSLNDLWKYNIASNLWTWMSGDNTGNNAGIYGTKGVAAAANKPGSRNRACRPDAKADASGNLWLFGGTGYAAAGTGDLNDLWKYNIAADLWTWMGGDNTTYAAGVYGTMGTAAAANKPGARVGGVCWIDTSGKFWLNGGSSAISGWTSKFSDLWKFDPATSLWTWVKGDNTIDNYGVYGTKGITAPSNNPGGRLMGACWIDNANNFWLFGGYGYSATGTGVSNGNQGLSDLWKYDPVSNNWTWMKGDSLPTQASVYGTQGISTAANKPGNRSGGDQWKDGYGNLWQFGGLDWGSPTVYRNDLWKLVIPQPVSKGKYNSCLILPAVTIDNSNNNTWVPVYDSIGYVAAEINANGNNLGIVNTSLFTKTGSCREDLHYRVYLNRNINIAPQNQPASGTVSVRLYIIKAELDSLRLALNSQGQPTGIASINDVDVFSNNDLCLTVGSNNAFPLTAAKGSYYSDYYLQPAVSSLASFYFANKLLVSILSVKILSFTGTRYATDNSLQWNAGCSTPVDFYIERSKNGIGFETIGSIAAVGCTAPFSYIDKNTVAPKNYYRLKIVEAGQVLGYSGTVLLQSDKKILQLSMLSSFVNTQHIIVQATVENAGAMQLQLIDATGRHILQKAVTLSPGNNTVSLYAGNLAAGMYYLYGITNTGSTNVLRFIKQ